MSMFCRLPTNSELRQMGMMSNSSGILSNKRKGCVIDNLLEAKRTHNLQQMRQELSSLIDKKSEFLNAQKRASLFVDTRCIADKSVMNEFAPFFKKLTSFAMEDGSDHMALIEETIKESIVIEWPRVFPGISDDGSENEIDFAPLIHRARSVVKCRTSHPTMRVKIYAASAENIGNCPQLLEILYRATLVKLTGESSNDNNRLKPVAGKMILTQREGIAAAKSQEHSGAMVNGDGKLICHQSMKGAELVLGTQAMEMNTRATIMKYEDGVLCATFPEMGVTLNSMIDRRQLSTRYAIQIEVFCNYNDQVVLNHTLTSHPFLIAITNDQTEPLLQSIFWHRLLNNDQSDISETYSDNCLLDWGTLRQAVRAFVKTQIPTARFLTDYEIRHIQCMILLQRIVRCNSVEQLQLLEITMFGELQTNNNQGLNEEKKRLRTRLLDEEIMDTFQIERREFMMEKCISILDMTTELSHTTWQWLHKSAEMIQDVGHKLCPSPSIDKKSSKTKRQMAASEDYQTVLSLFNKGIITFCSTHKASLSIPNMDKPCVMLMRFCDENIGQFSICYGMESGKPKIGSISSEQIKDFKQGLPEVLIDEHYPSKYSYLLKLSLNDTSDTSASVPVLKRDVFHTYTTQRLKMDSVAILDNETIRVDVLSGAQLARQTPSPTQNIMSANSLDLNVLTNNPQFVNTILPFIQTMPGAIDFSAILKEMCSGSADSSSSTLPSFDSLLHPDVIKEEQLDENTIEENTEMDEEMKRIDDGDVDIEASDDRNNQIAQLLLNDYQ